MDNKTKWLLGCGGCGGCLVLIAVIVVLTGGLAVLGLHDYQNNSQKMVQEFFGDNPPKGYTVITAAPFGKYGEMLYLMNMRTRKDMIITKYRLSAAKAGYFKTMTDEKIRAHAEEIIKGGKSVNPFSDSRMDGTISMTFFGQEYPVARVLYGPEDKPVPALVTTFLLGKDDLLDVIVQDLSEPGSNDVDDEFDGLKNELTMIVGTLAFSNQLYINPDSHDGP